MTEIYIAKDTGYQFPEDEKMLSITIDFDTLVYYF